MSNGIVVVFLAIVGATVVLGLAYRVAERMKQHEEHERLLQLAGMEQDMFMAALSLPPANIFQKRGVAIPDLLGRGLSGAEALGIARERPIVVNNAAGSGEPDPLSDVPFEDEPDPLAAVAVDDEGVPLGERGDSGPAT